jgi:hypothetical protein
MANTSESEYIIRFLEKENDRLTETVKQTRQNALALVAAVLVLNAAMMQIPYPLVGDLRKAQYSGSYQTHWMGLPGTPEREIAIQHLTHLWNLATLSTVVTGFITILFAVFLFMRAGSYAPILDMDSAQSATRQEYLGILLRQNKELKNANKSYWWRLALPAFTALLTVAGCGLVTILWLWFGGVSESPSKIVGG